jgi:hypothetical protein
VESVFESYSIKAQASSSLAESGSNAEAPEIRVVTKGNAILAYEDVMKMWKIDLTLQQEKRFKEEYFKSTWGKFQNEDNCLDLHDSYRFLQELMQKGQGKPIDSDKAGIGAKK